MFPINTSIYRVLVLLLAPTTLFACASPAQMQNMVVAPQSSVADIANSPFKNALVISRVNGGQKTNPMWTSEIDGAAFQGALSASLQRNKLLAKSLPSSKFELFAILGSVNQPLVGLSMTVSSAVIYRVVERETQVEWFNDTVFASYTAKFGESLIGIQRLRFANEGSIRENIKEFIRRLVATKPPKASAPKVTKTNDSSAEELLRLLNKLLDRGLIEKEDYERKKDQILKSI